MLVFDLVSLLYAVTRAKGDFGDWGKSLGFGADSALW